MSGRAVSFSPESIDAASNTIPAVTISIAPAIIPEGSSMREPYTDPNAQLIDPIRISSAPHGFPLRLPPLLSRIMPAIPMAIPSHSSLRVLMPNRRLKQRVNRGTVATTTAAIPEGTFWCSATVTKPFPTASNRMPIRAALRSGRSGGSLWPRRNKNASRSTPAERKRTPAIIRGGQLSTPIRITK